MQYTHLLIAQPREFVPRPTDLTTYWHALTHIGAAPMGGKILVLKSTHITRMVMNPFTGEEIPRPVYERVALESLEELPESVGLLDDYDVYIAGRGPPRTPPLPISFDSEYHLAIKYHVRRQPEETSIWRNEIERNACAGGVQVPDDDVGIFRSPTTGEFIKVSRARLARFWIEFELGKFLFPVVHNTFDLLNSEIVGAANEVFGTLFVQGSRWE